MRPPARGWVSLLGYSGQQDERREDLQHMPGGRWQAAGGLGPGREAHDEQPLHDAQQREGEQVPGELPWPDEGQRQERSGQEHRPQVQHVHLVDGDRRGRDPVDRVPDRHPRTGEVPAPVRLGVAEQQCVAVDVLCVGRVGDQPGRHQSDRQHVPAEPSQLELVLAQVFVGERHGEQNPGGAGARRQPGEDAGDPPVPGSQCVEAGDGEEQDQPRGVRRDQEERGREHDQHRHRPVCGPLVELAADQAVQHDQHAQQREAGDDQPGEDRWPRHHPIEPADQQTVEREERPDASVLRGVHPVVAVSGDDPVEAPVPLPPGADQHLPAGRRGLEQMREVREQHRVAHAQQPGAGAGEQ
jgi:hypothetical protein